MGRTTYQHTRWNFVVIVLDASAFMAGFAFLDPVAVLPLLVNELSGSKVIIGLLTSLQRAGWLLPQLLATSFVLHRPRKKPFFVYPCLISRIPLLLLALAFCLPWAASHPRTLLIFLIAGYSIFFFGDGLSGVPWHDTIARTIPPGLRGRFFGAMQLVSGILAVGAGALVRIVLSDDSLRFPLNYGILFAFLSIGMVLSTVFLALIREPQGAAAKEPQSFAQIVRAIPATLRACPPLRRLIVGQNMCGVASIAIPFYTVYAHSELDLPVSASGLFIWAGILGSVSMSMIWAYLNDRRGSHTVIRAVSWLVMVTPLSALLAAPAARAMHLEQATAAVYCLVFFLNGATWGGAWMGFTNSAMALAPDDVRPLFLGLQATLCAPTIIMPLLGGWLLTIVSFHTLFALVAASGLATVLYVRRLA